MTAWLVLGLALGLAMDAFAVAIGASLSRGGLSRRQALRMAACFGIFQFAMPLIGWAAGRTVVDLIGRYDHWAAAALLVFVAGRMIREALEEEAPEGRRGRAPLDPSRWGPLLVLSVATSLDSLAAGLGLAALRAPVLAPALVIGVVAFAVTLTGTRIGPAIGRKLGKGAEILGALVLLGIAAKILVDHLG